MAKRDELLAMAERCEKAEGADREIDEIIAAALSDAVREVQSDGRSAYYHRSGSPWMCVAVPNPGYTASLDAAMTLVPEGWRLANLAEWIGWIMREKGAWRVALTGLTPSRSRIEVEHAATPALALCAAALRARAAMEVE